MAGQPLIKRFAELARKKARLKAELKAVEAKIKAIHDQVLDFMVKYDIQNQKVGGRTVFVHRELWATKREDVEPEAFVRMLQNEGFDGFTTYSPQRLTEYVRELDDQGSEDDDPDDETPAWKKNLPEALVNSIKVDERFSVRSRKE